MKLENGRVYTDLYKKPSDKQLYLKKSSCHPSHTKTGLAYGLALRIRRICEKYRLLHGVFDPSPDLSPSRRYQPEPEGRGLIRSKG